MKITNKNIQQNQIFSIVAERTGFSEELVKFVINHMWSNIRENIISPKTWKLMINNFGIFQPKEKRIKHLLNAIDINKGNTKIRKEKLQEFNRILSLKQNKKQNNNENN